MKIVEFFFFFLSQGLGPRSSLNVAKLPIKDTLKEDKPPQDKHIKSPLNEDNLSTKDKTASPECVFKIGH